MSRERLGRRIAMSANTIETNAVVNAANAADLNDVERVFAENEELSGRIVRLEASLEEEGKRQISLRKELGTLKDERTHRRWAIERTVREVFERMLWVVAIGIIGYVAYKVATHPTSPKNCYVRVEDAETSVYTVEASGEGDIAIYANPAYAAEAADRCRKERDKTCTVRSSHYTQKVWNAFVLYGDIPWMIDPKLGVTLAYERATMMAMQSGCKLGPK
jgi:hypothetical protein